MNAPLDLTWPHFLLIGTIVSGVLISIQTEQTPRRIRHDQRSGGLLVSRPSLLYLTVMILLDVLTWTLTADVAYLTVLNITDGHFYPLQSAICCAAAFTTNRLIRRGLSQQVFAAPEGLYIEQWNHNVFLAWDTTEGQWNLKAGRWPFYGVIQRRGTAPLLLRRYRLSVCLNAEITQPPHMLNRPGHVIDVTHRT